MSDPSIYELMQRVREHPDYAFGVLFTRNDMPDNELPEAQALSAYEERLAELGAEMIHE